MQSYRNATSYPFCPGCGHGLILDQLNAALVKRYGPGVRSEIDIDELKGTIRLAVLRTVVETVAFDDPSISGAVVVRHHVFTSLRAKATAPLALSL